MTIHSVIILTFNFNPHLEGKEVSVIIQCKQSLLKYYQLRIYNFSLILYIELTITVFFQLRYFFFGR